MSENGTASQGECSSWESTRCVQEALRIQAEESGGKTEASLQLKFSGWQITLLKAVI